MLPDCGIDRRLHRQLAQDAGNARLRGNGVGAPGRLGGQGNEDAKKEDQQKQRLAHMPPDVREQALARQGLKKRQIARLRALRA